MSKQRRWFCRECKREWHDHRASNESGGMYANSSPYIPFNGKNCQICGSPEIQLIEYTPPYPGLDIPRDGNYRIVPVDNIQTVPGLTTNQDMNIQSAREPENIIPFPISHEIPNQEDQKKAVVETIQKNNYYDSGVG